MAWKIICTCLLGLISISGKTIQEFSNLKAGDYITVANVEATGPAGKVFLGGTSLLVK